MRQNETLKLQHEKIISQMDTEHKRKMNNMAATHKSKVNYNTAEYELTIKILEDKTTSLDESKNKLRIIYENKIKSLREIVNGYFELRSLEQGKQQFISQHATMLEPLLLGTLKKLASLLEDYRLARGQTAMNFEATVMVD